MSLKFVQTGDAHIDSDQHGTINPKTGMNTAWESHLRALTSAVDLALAENADAFFHNGDAVKHGRPTQEAVLLFAGALMPLVKAGIPVVLVDGNHERHQVQTNQRTVTLGVSSILEAHGEVHAVEREPLLVRLSNGLQVACLPWLSKTTILNRLGEEALGLSPTESDVKIVDYAKAALDRMVSEADTTAPLVMASHVTLDDVRIDALAPGHSRGSEVDIAHIFAEPILPRAFVEHLPFSYVGLSHIHTPQRIGQKCFYAGSPDRLTMTDADSPKSVNLVTLEDDNTLSEVRQVATDARQMTRIDLTEARAESQLDALEPGTLVGLVLAPGESMPPPAITQQISEAGAHLVSTKRVPLDRRHVEAVRLPEKTAPLDALRQWLAHTTPEGVEDSYAIALASNLMEARA